MLGLTPDLPNQIPGTGAPVPVCLTGFPGDSDATAPVPLGRSKRGAQQGWGHGAQNFLFAQVIVEVDLEADGDDSQGHVHSPASFSLSPCPGPDMGLILSQTVTGFIGCPATGQVPGSAWVLSKYLWNQLKSPGTSSGRRWRTAELDPSHCPSSGPGCLPRDPMLGCQTGSMGRVYMGWAEGGGHKETFGLQPREPFLKEGNLRAER